METAVGERQQVHVMAFRHTHRFMVLHLIVASALCISAITGSALAQSDSDRATARALAEEGYNALKAQKFDIAQDRFRRADALVHAPTLVVDEGRALIGLGRYLDAQEKFELVLREGVAENAPPVWKSAVAEAAKLLNEVKPKVAWLTIVVPNVTHPHVAISGRPISEAALGVKFALNPGSQTVEVSADGYRPRTQSIALGEGSEQTIEVTLDPLPSESAPKQQIQIFKPKQQQAQPNYTGEYVALGFGVTGIVVGSITGFLALHKRSDLKAACPNGQCPPSAESTLNGYHTLGTISGVGFGVGVVGLATGFILLKTGGNNDGKTATPYPLHLQLGVNNVALQGSF